MQIKDEAFVEDINNLLNAGEVPNMFPQDERMQVGGSHRLCPSNPLGAEAVQDPQYIACTKMFSTVAKTHIAQVMEMVRPLATKQGLETPLELWGFFVTQCKRFLHVVLAMSPIGGAFRERLRQNPSLVNCCTIDWCVGARIY